MSRELSHSTAIDGEAHANEHGIASFSGHGDLAQSLEESGQAQAAGEEYRHEQGQGQGQGIGED